MVNGFTTAFGFLIAIVLMAGVREKIEYNDIPKPFQGTAIVLISACLDVNRIHGILRNDLGGKEDERYSNFICSLNRGRRRYLDWIFPWYFRRKVQGRGR